MHFPPSMSRRSHYALRLGALALLASVASWPRPTRAGRPPVAAAHVASAHATR